MRSNIEKFANLPKYKKNGNFKKTKKQKINLSDMKRLTLGGAIWLFIKYLVIFIILAIIIYPIFYLLVSSVNGSLPNDSLSTTKPFTLTWDFYKYLGQTEYWTWMYNSLLIGFISMLIVVIFSGFMAYGFSRYSFTGKKSWMIFVLLIGLVPNLIALTIFYILSDLLFNNMGLPRMTILIMLYAGGGIVGNLYILKSYIDGISRDLDDSGKIDGLSNWKLFIKIIVPLARPMLSIVAFWSFLAPFGDVILSSLILFDSKDFTLPIGLKTFINNPDPTLVNLPAFAAGSIVVSIPIVVIFMVLQRNIKRGLASGAVKG